MRSTLLCLLLIANLAVAAQPARVLQATGLHKLDVFVGTWKSQGNPAAAGDAVPSAVTTCAWSPNGKYLVCDQLVTDHRVQTNNLSIYSYDADKDRYMLSLVGVPGMAPFAIPVTAHGDTLIYASDYTDHGKKIYIQTLNIFSTPTDYIYQVRTSEDGLNWRPGVEGRSVKAPGR